MERIVPEGTAPLAAAMAKRDGVTQTEVEQT